MLVRIKFKHLNLKLLTFFGASRSYVRCSSTASMSGEHRRRTVVDHSSIEVTHWRGGLFLEAQGEGDSVHQHLPACSWFAPWKFVIRTEATLKYTWLRFWIPSASWDRTHLYFTIGCPSRGHPLWLLHRGSNFLREEASAALVALGNHSMASLALGRLVEQMLGRSSVSETKSSWNFLLTCIYSLGCGIRWSLPLSGAECQTCPSYTSLKASLHSPEHSAWAKEASKIWFRVVFWSWKVRNYFAQFMLFRPAYVRTCRVSSSSRTSGVPKGHCIELAASSEAVAACIVGSGSSWVGALVEVQSSMVSCVIVPSYSGVSCSARFTVSNWWTWHQFDRRNVASNTPVGSSPLGSCIAASGSVDSA